MRERIDEYERGRRAGYDEGYSRGWDDGWNSGYDDGFASADDWLMRSEDALRAHGWIREEERHGGAE